MTSDDMKSLFSKHGSEYLEFTRIPKADRLSHRPDIHAFILLDRIVEPEMVAERAGDYAFDMVCGAEHDKIYLQVNTDSLAEFITEDEIIELSRCGINYNHQESSLWMFV